MISRILTDDDLAVVSYEDIKIRNKENKDLANPYKATISYIDPGKGGYVYLDNGVRSEVFGIVISIFNDEGWLTNVSKLKDKIPYMNKLFLKNRQIFTVDAWFRGNFHAQIKALDYGTAVQNATNLNCKTNVDFYGLNISDKGIINMNQVETDLWEAVLWIHAHTTYRVPANCAEEAAMIIRNGGGFTMSNINFDITASGITSVTDVVGKVTYME